MYLGIDIGGTTTKIAAADNSGQLQFETSFSTTACADASQFLTALETEIRGVITQMPEPLKGIGVGAPSVNYRTGIIENAANLGWKGKLDLRAHLQKAIGCPVAITNDANLPAIGEMTYGAAQAMRDFVTISLGTGLGCGIVANGLLVGGHHGMAGELGHSLVKLNGRRCGCGRRGCLETYVSATGLKRTVFKMLSDHNGGSILEKYTFEQLTASEITKAAMDGDEIAGKAFRYTGKILGLKLADLLVITDPEAIFLVGGLAQAGDLLFNPTKEALNRHKLDTFESEVKIMPSNLPLEKVSLLGACGLVINTEDTINSNQQVGLP